MLRLLAFSHPLTPLCSFPSSLASLSPLCPFLTFLSSLPSLAHVPSFHRPSQLSLIIPGSFLFLSSFFLCSPIPTSSLPNPSISLAWPCSVCALFLSTVLPSFLLGLYAFSGSSISGHSGGVIQSF